VIYKIVGIYINYEENLRSEVIDLHFVLPSIINSKKPWYFPVFSEFMEVKINFLRDMLMTTI